MNALKRYFSTAVLACLFAMGLSAQERDRDLQTESPYFLIEGEMPEDFDQASFALKGTEVDVNISGIIAEVTVEQRYVNSSESVLHSRYVFPGSSHSAIYAMEMQINDRVVKAEIKEKQQAQEIFDKAKQEGKSASLMKQHRPNVFEMSLANIRPGDEIIVRFSYTENIVPRNKLYEFVFPTIVGPRYADADMAAKDPWVMNPHVNENHPKHAQLAPSFQMNLALNGGMPVNQAQWNDLDGATIEYAGENTVIGEVTNQVYQKNRSDMVFRYQLAGAAINSGLLLYEGEEENFFLYTVQPPERPTSGTIPPRDYIFIVDVSGSMNGFPIEVSKTLIKDLLSGLNENDRFNILTFASGYDAYEDELIQATEDEIEDAIDFIDDADGYGGTEVLPALEKAFDMVNGKGRSTTIVIATDGLVTVEREAMEIIHTRLGEANFFPFGIGDQSNRYMIEAMAHAALTEPFICMNRDQAKRKAREFRTMLLAPVLTDIKVSFDGLQAYDVVPASVPDLFADRPVVVFGKYKGPATGNIRISGSNGAGGFQQDMRLASADRSAENGALRYLWAREKVKMLSDFHRAEPDEELQHEITALGLNYNLLTEFTSFVGVDNERSPVEVQKSMPSGSGGGVPEPQEWTLIFFGLLLLTYLVYQSRKMIQSA